MNKHKKNRVSAKETVLVLILMIFLILLVVFCNTSLINTNTNEINSSKEDIITQTTMATTSEIFTTTCILTTTLATTTCSETNTTTTEITNAETTTNLNVTKSSENISENSDNNYEFEEEYEEYVEEEPDNITTYNDTISYYDYVMLCNCVAYEAGSEWIDEYEKAKVVEVIMNRVNSSYFPNTIYEVLTQEGQFSGVWEYVGLSEYSYKVTENVTNAVDLYFSNPSQFNHGYLYFEGDGNTNYFS